MTRSTCKLLIVEDDMDYAEFVGAKLKAIRSALEITIATTYDEAAWLTSWREFDFALVDTFLGGPRTGIALIRELKLQGNKLPVAILSAATRGPLRQLALDLGAIAIIDKAYAKMEDIDEIIEMSIATETAQTEARDEATSVKPSMRQKSSNSVEVAPELTSIAAIR